MNPKFCDKCRDAERYRWLVRQNPLAIASIAFRFAEACKLGTAASVSECVDAAMKQEAEEA